MLLCCSPSRSSVVMEADSAENVGRKSKSAGNLSTPGEILLSMHMVIWRAVFPRR